MLVAVVVTVCVVTVGATSPSGSEEHHSGVGHVLGAQAGKEGGHARLGHGPECGMVDRGGGERGSAGAGHPDGETAFGETTDSQRAVDGKGKA
jgi:hypothetical protein